MTAGPPGDFVVEVSPGEVRVALIESDAMTELLVFRRTDPPRLGEVFSGRVTRIERGYNAAFVEIGMGPPGFLPLKGGARGVREGETLSVAVAGEAAPGKGPRLAVAPGRAKPHRDVDPGAAALRAIASHEPDVAVDGAAGLARLRAAAREFPDLAKRLTLHMGSAPAFDALGIEEQIEYALAPEIALDSGLRLHFGETPALVAVDVDAAGFVPRKGARATALDANLSAAAAVARQIRLRNLSGLIVIDFLRMKDTAERKRLAESLAKFSARDPVPLHVHGFTRSGLLELTRERRRRPLSQVLLQPQAVRRKSPETIAHEALRAAMRAPSRGMPLTLAAAPEVIAWLEGEGREDLLAVESLLHVKLFLKTSAGATPEEFQILESVR